MPVRRASATDFSWICRKLAHGPQREVEVLHDQLLAAFNADPSLTPRDRIVMVPDIDAYAPYIQAVFGLLDRSDPRFIPYSVADQGQRATDPLVQTLATLLALPQSRLAVSDLLDLLDVPALRRCFGIDADDLPRLHRWARGANVRWGLHAEQHASLDLPPQPEAQTQHTWRFGLRRGRAHPAAAAVDRRRVLAVAARRGKPLAALLCRRRHPRHPHAHARHPLPSGLPARHERQRLPAPTQTHGLRPHGPGLSAGRPLAARGRPLSLFKTFFRQRLGVYFEDDEGPGEDQEPFALDGLERWQLQNELIHVQAAALARDETIEPARAERMDRIRRRGDLAAGASGEALAAELVAPMDDLFERYQKALARWPRTIEEEAPIRFEAADAQLPPLADWLGGLRIDAAGERGRVVLESSDLVKDKQYRAEVIIRHWVMHLAGHLAGAPLTTQVISKVGDVELKPLTIEQAQALLSDLLTAWRAGMRQPLPLTAKTAFAWLKTGQESAARKVYEGADPQRGEVETDAYLARAYSGFDSLCADGAFVHWAETLLRPLFEALHTKE